jgi:hypothetical protein
VTGEEKWGGMQLEAYPVMRADVRWHVGGRPDTDQTVDQTSQELGLSVGASLTMLADRVETRAQTVADCGLSDGGLLCVAIWVSVWIWASVSMGYRSAWAP